MTPFKRGDYVLDTAHAHGETVREAVYRFIRPERDSYWEARPMGERPERGVKTYLPVRPQHTLCLTAAQVRTIFGT